MIEVNNPASWPCKARSVPLFSHFCDIRRSKQFSTFPKNKITSNFVQRLQMDSLDPPVSDENSYRFSTIISEPNRQDYSLVQLERFDSSLHLQTFHNVEPLQTLALQTPQVSSGLPRAEISHVHHVEDSLNSINNQFESVVKVTDDLSSNELSYVPPESNDNEDKGKNEWEFSSVSEACNPTIPPIPRKSKATIPPLPQKCRIRPLPLKSSSSVPLGFKPNTPLILPNPHLRSSPNTPLNSRSNMQSNPNEVDANIPPIPVKSHSHVPPIPIKCRSAIPPIPKKLHRTKTTIVTTPPDVSTRLLQETNLDHIRFRVLENEAIKSNVEKGDISNPPDIKKLQFYPMHPNVEVEKNSASDPEYQSDDTRNCLLAVDSIKTNRPDRRRSGLKRSNVTIRGPKSSIASKKYNPGSEKVVNVGDSNMIHCNNPTTLEMDKKNEKSPNFLRKINENRSYRSENVEGENKLKESLQNLNLSSDYPNYYGASSPNDPIFLMTTESPNSQKEIPELFENSSNLSDFKSSNFKPKFLNSINLSKLMKAEISPTDAPVSSKSKAFNLSPINKHKVPKNGPQTNLNQHNKSKEDKSAHNTPKARRKFLKIIETNEICEEHSHQQTQILTPVLQQKFGKLDKLSHKNSPMNSPQLDRRQPKSSVLGNKQNLQKQGKGGKFEHAPSFIIRKSSFDIIEKDHVPLLRKNQSTRYFPHQDSMDVILRYENSKPPDDGIDSCPDKDVDFHDTFQRLQQNKNPNSENASNNTISQRMFERARSLRNRRKVIIQHEG